MSVNKTNGSADDSEPPPRITTSASLDADLTQLTALLSQDSLDSTDEANVTELLKRLESADGMAKGIESKLDSILGSLDDLLNTLERQEQSASNGAQPPQKPVDSDKPEAT